MVENFQKKTKGLYIPWPSPENLKLRTSINPSHSVMVSGLVSEACGEAPLGLSDVQANTESESQCLIEIS